MSSEYVCSIGIAGSTFHREDVKNIKVKNVYLLLEFLKWNPEIDDLSFTRQIDGEEENTIIKHKIDGKVTGEK